MRFIAFAALAALSFGLVGTAPASAAHAKCHAEHGCKERSAKKSHYKKASKHHQHKHAQKAHKRAAKKAHKPANTASYGGGSHGIASYYWQGQKTASGARFNPNAMTAAHRTYPFGTRVRVTNKRNGRSVVVTINDRGPFIKGRIIDLSKAAAGVIGMQGAGLAPVSVERL